MSSLDAPLVSVCDLAVHFPVTRGVLFTRRTGTIRAVDGISLEIRRGETLGLVGESGCGKSTAGRAILQLIKPTAGQVVFDGRELTSLWQDGRWTPALRDLRRRMQMIFQDPYASLDPRMTVEDIVAEPLSVFGRVRGLERRRAVQALMMQVGLDPRYVRRYPHEFSGGQRQRIGVARALALRPDFIVADEPIAALDVSIQAQILNLLAELKRELRLTYLFIAHDLAAVRQISDRIAVMYLGTIVEESAAESLYTAPLHPYTQALISAVPLPDPAAERRRRRVILSGDVPSPLNPPSGCRFHPRCPLYATLGEADRSRCRAEVPVLRAVVPGRLAACHYARA